MRENYGSMLTDKLNEIRESISEQVVNASSAILSYKDNLKTQLQNSMNEGAASIKETLGNQIDGIFGSGSGGGIEGSDDTGIASLLSFAYSDYLRLFLMIGLYANESGVLLRTADVIQANMQMKTPEFLMSNSAVYVEIETSVQVKPTLLAMPLFSDVEGNPVGDTNWYTINYKTIRGY